MVNRIEQDGETILWKIIIGQIKMRCSVIYFSKSAKEVKGIE